MKQGEPFVRVRTSSDYWLYARLFSSTCPVALVEDRVVGAIIAFRSQDDPRELYIQDVMTAPDYRRRGVARTLLGTLRGQALRWAVRRLYLTSEPANTEARATWEREGFINCPGDFTVNGGIGGTRSQGCR